MFVTRLDGSTIARASRRLTDHVHADLTHGEVRQAHAPVTKDRFERRPAVWRRVQQVVHGRALGQALQHLVHIAEPNVQVLRRDVGQTSNGAQELRESILEYDHARGLCQTARRRGVPRLDRLARNDKRVAQHNAPVVGKRQMMLLVGIESDVVLDVEHVAGATEHLGAGIAGAAPRAGVPLTGAKHAHGFPPRNIELIEVDRGHAGQGGQGRR